jgi:hypothetical protein
MSKSDAWRHAKAATTTAGRPAVLASDLLSLESLLAAKKLVNALGSVEAAKTAVNALAKLR